MNEQWKDVPGYEGFYEVSNFGRIRSVDREFTTKSGQLRKYPGKEICFQVHMKGYLILWLHKEGVRVKVYVHRIVAMAFYPNPENKEHVNHKDKNRKNNHWLNLEWATLAENLDHRDNFTPNDDPF